MAQLLLLHGALGNANSLQPLATLLGANHEVWTPDLPGHREGQPLPSSLKLPLLAAWLHNWIAQQGLEKPYLFGYSLGGYIGLLLERTHPGTFSGICTYGTRLLWNPEFAALQEKQLDLETLATKAPQVLEHWEKSFGAGWRQIHRLTLEMMQDLGTQPYLDEPGIENISIPVMLGVGEKDHMVDLAQTAAMANRIPGARYELLTAQPHLIEKADASIITNFIQQQLS